MNRRTMLKSVAGVAAVAQGKSVGLPSSSSQQRARKPVADSQGEPCCYTKEWRRTQPDYVLYLPPDLLGNDGDNEQVQVIETPKGDLLSVWSQGTYDMSRGYRTVGARSRDGGATWSKPKMIVGPTEHPGFTAAWAVPIVSRKGRIYLLFDKHSGVSDLSHTVTGLMRCVYSDNDGYTWNEGADLGVRRRPECDHSDPEVPKSIIIWQLPIRDSKNRLIVGLSRWSSLSRFPMASGPEGWFPDSRSEFVRFENIDEGSLPKNLKLTWLPQGDSISVPCPFEPFKSRGYSLAEEPALALLPDGRLFAVRRTITDKLWYSVSEDPDGSAWRKSEVLRYRDHGAMMLHPKNTAPLYRLRDGRYVLFFSES